MKSIAYSFYLGLLLFMPQCVSGQVVHALVVGDTSDEKIGRGVQIDVSRICFQLEKMIPKQHLELKTVTGAQVSWDGIISQLIQIRANENDAMLFFYSGHGAFDNYDDGMNGHFFAMPQGERLYRSAVVRHVARRGAGLDAVISSSCNVFLPIEGRAPASAAAPARAYEETRNFAPLAASLFFREKGLVNINGASEGEIGISHPFAGTSTFNPFCDFLLRNSDRPMTWKSALQHIKNDVKSGFALNYPNGFMDQNRNVQHTQTLRVWNTPPGAPAGVRGEIVKTNLEVGDRITSINGSPIGSENDFFNAVKSSPSEMVFTVINVRDGFRLHLRATLRPINAQSRFGVFVNNNATRGVTVSALMANHPHSDLEIMGRQRGRMDGN